MARRLLFQELAHDLTVERIYEPRLGEVDSGDSVEHAFSQKKYGEDRWLQDTGSWVLVRERGEVIGLLDEYKFLVEIRDTMDPDLYSRCVRDFVYRIPATRRIPLDMPFAKALRLFKTDTTPFFVGNGPETIGVFSLDSIVEPRALFCYLALALDLESAALDRCTYAPLKNWSYLPPDRQKKAWKRYLEKMKKHRRIEHETGCDSDEEKTELQEFLIRDVLQVTDLADKREMLLKGNLTISPSKKTIKRVFERAMRVRNACAHCFSTSAAHPDRWETHPSDLFEISATELPKFVEECLQLIDEIDNVTPKEDRDEEQP